MRILKIVFILAAACAANSMRSTDYGGSLQSGMEPGSQALGVKTIAPSIFSGGGVSGKVDHGVNLLTGQPSYSIGLGGLNVRGVNYPIDLSYSGGAKNLYENDNQIAPTSWVGMGWNLGTPYVAVNHKGTYFSYDDVIYCNLGPYGGGQILMDSTGSRYYVSSNPYIKVAFDTATSGDLQGQFTAWVFTFPNGMKMAFGQDTNTQRYVMYNQGIIAASPRSTVPSQRFIYRWDVRTIYDSIPSRPPRNKISFEYERFLDTAAPARYYVREGYVKKIKWMEGGLETESYEFKTGSKGTGEYVGYAANEPRYDQKLFETRFLDTLKCYKEGILDHLYKFDRTVGKKALLDSIRVYYPPPLSGLSIRDSGWAFTYDPLRFNTLLTVKNPDSRKDRYTYSLFSFVNFGGDQSTEHPFIKRLNRTAVMLPTDLTRLANWSVESSCDDRFCFSIVYDADDLALPGDTTSAGVPIKQKAYVEVHRNLGNYFDTRSVDSSITAGETITARFELMDPYTAAKDWKILNAGNYFLVVDQAHGKIIVNEFDGVKWTERYPFAGDPRYSYLSGFNQPVSVTVAPNYFLVQSRAAPSGVVVALRGATSWTSLNRDSHACQFDNQSNYGESIRGSGGSCLEWTRSSLSLTASPNYFLVLDSATNVFCAYALKKDGSGFTEISKKFQVVTSPANTIQVAGYPMNWQKPVLGVYAAGDYFLVQSQATSPTTALYLNGFQFDGDTLKEVANYQRSSTGTGTLQVFPASDYFVLADQGDAGKVTYWEKQAPTPGSLTFVNRTVLGSPYPSGAFLNVHLSANAIALEYAANSQSIGYRPKWEASGTDVASYLYQVNKGFTNGVADRSSDLIGPNGRKLSNISLSASENMLLGSNMGTHATGARCNENVDAGDCLVAYYTLRTHPDDLTHFVHVSEGDRKQLGMIGDPYTQKKAAMSQCGRIGSFVKADTSSHTVIYSVFQFDGKGFDTVDSQWVVTLFCSDAARGSADRDNIQYRFQYPVLYGNDDAEFNCNLQLPQFGYCSVRQVNSFVAAPGSAVTYFNIDTQSKPISGKRTLLIGTERASRVLNAAGDTVSMMDQVTSPYHAPGWPFSLYLNRTLSTTSRSLAANKSRTSDTTYYFNYCDSNGAPSFVLRDSRPGKIHLSQSIFDARGFPRQTIEYNLSAQPDTNALKQVGAADTAYRRTGAAASAKFIYTDYRLLEDSAWRDFDESMTDAQMRVKTNPIFRLDENWLAGTKITKRDSTNFFQVLETRTIKNKIPSALGARFSSAFYEGLRSDPTAMVSNSKLANSAILLAENGNAGLAAGVLDLPMRWNANGAAFFSGRSHTGRYCFKVTDNYGPQTDLTLEDTRLLGYGMTLSAWVYSDTGTPVLTLSRIAWPNTVIGTDTAHVADGSSPLKKTWQRWEIRLSNSQLIAGNLFNANPDFLRVRIGTGAPAGRSARIVYVDDIVCVPSNASFALTTYDRRGLPTSTTNTTHNVQYYDIGFNGRISAVRDESYGIHNQSASHAMGEN